MKIHLVKIGPLTSMHFGFNKCLHTVVFEHDRQCVEVCLWRISTNTLEIFFIMLRVRHLKQQ